MDCLSIYGGSIPPQTAKCRGSSVVEQCLDKALAKSSILFLGTKLMEMPP